MYLVNGSRSVLVYNMMIWLVNVCIWYSNNMIVPCYPESVANEVLSTVGGVRFIKWTQDPLVSFVKDDNPSFLPCGGNKHYNAFKDILAPIWFVFSVIVINLEWHLRLKVMLQDPTSQPLKSSLTLKGKSFLHNKPVGDRLHCIASILWVVCLLSIERKNMSQPSVCKP